MATNPRIAGRVKYGYALWLIIGFALLTGCTNSKPPKTAESAVAETKEDIPPGSTVIRGAGATFPSLLYKRWFSAYHSLHSGTYIEYALVGSGEGVRRFMGKNVADAEQVEFGASDAAMTDQQLMEVNNNALMVPATAGCVVLAYNLPGFNGELKLSRRAYAGIFLGEITNWNDRRIAESNPGSGLP